jgi:DNA-binding MarR family transcriptional regulator
MGWRAAARHASIRSPITYKQGLRTAAVQAVPGGPSVRCVCSAVRRVDRVLNRLYDEALRPSGLTTTQYALLSTLSRAGRPLTHGELVAQQEVAGTTLSRTLKPLARDGWVRIVPGEDRRTRYVAITAAGKAILEEARPLWRSVQEHVVTEVGPERVERLAELAEVAGRLRA